MGDRRSDPAHAIATDMATSRVRPKNAPGAPHIFSRPEISASAGCLHRMPFRPNWP